MAAWKILWGKVGYPILCCQAVGSDASPQVSHPCRAHLPSSGFSTAVGFPLRGFGCRAFASWFKSLSCSAPSSAHSSRSSPISPHKWGKVIKCWFLREKDSGNTFQPMTVEIQGNIQQERTKNVPGPLAERCSLAISG